MTPKLERPINELETVQDTAEDAYTEANRLFKKRKTKEGAAATSLEYTQMPARI